MLTNSYDGIESAVAVLEPPAAEPLTLAEVKLHCAVDGNEFDTLLTSLITAARQYVEKIGGRALITQTWQLQLDCFPCNLCGRIELPGGPAQSIESVKYIDTDGDEQTMAEADYVLRPTGGNSLLCLGFDKAWPDYRYQDGEYPVKIAYVVGYPYNSEDSPAEPPTINVPESIKQAMKLLIAHWYQNRETVVIGSTVERLPLAVESMLGLDRIY